MPVRELWNGLDKCFVIVAERVDMLATTSGLQARVEIGQEARTRSHHAHYHFATHTRDP